MKVERLGRDTTSVTSLTWSGHGFGGDPADSMWTELSERLRSIALAEIRAGNTPRNILKNDALGVVLLAFAEPPKVSSIDDNHVRVHTSFETGNYCYDGTRCTYEDMASGGFLAFDDPGVANDP